MDSEWVDRWKDGIFTPMGSTERAPDLAGSSGIGMMLAVAGKAYELNVGTHRDACETFKLDVW